MKKHGSVFFIVLMLISLSFPLSQSSTNESLKQALNVDTPVWEMDDEWRYRLEVTFLLQDGTIDGSIDLSINPLIISVEQRTTEQYQLGFQGDVTGDIFLDIGFGLRGRLIDTEVNGHVILAREHLSIQNTTLHIDGKLKISLITVDINLDLVASYSPALTIIDFPLTIGKQWETNTTTVTYVGSLNIPGVNALLQLIFGDTDDEIPDQIPIDYNETMDPTNNICSDIVTRTVGGMGPYECYQIDSENNTLYYCPLFGTFIKYVPKGKNQNIEFSLDLISSTYRIPGSPSIPMKPVGETQIDEDVEYSYTTSATDAELDEIYYLFDWGDGTSTGWIGPYPSGETVNQSHSWSEENTYTIRVKAKDVNDHETRWSQPLRVTLQKAKIWHHPILSWILEKITQFINIINDFMI